MVVGASIAFNVKPSELIVVDLCSSFAKDLANLEMCGIRMENYFGFDNDTDSPFIAQDHHRTMLNLVTTIDLVNQPDDAINACILQRLNGQKAHLVLCNFAIHLFANDLEKVFRLASNWAHDSCFLQCSYISLDGIHKVVNNYERYGVGVSFTPDTNTLLIDGMAKYAFEPCLTKMTPTILRENNEGGFANNGKVESIISDEALLESARKGGKFYAISQHDDCAHEKLFEECVAMHMGATITERTMACLHAFMTLHKTILFKRIPLL
jgi:hypothetical protein